MPIVLVALLVVGIALIVGVARRSRGGGGRSDSSVNDPSLWSTPDSSGSSNSHASSHDSSSASSDVSAHHSSHVDVGGGHSHH